jgi:hypothetical protein
MDEVLPKWSFGVRAAAPLTNTIMAYEQNFGCNFR